MKCPVCYKKLESETIQGIELNACRSCNGYWFDPGEMEELREKGRQLFGRSAPSTSSFEMDHAAELKNCPRCEELTLQSAKAGVTSPPLNRCSKCQGYFAHLKNPIALDILEGILLSI